MIVFKFGGATTRSVRGLDTLVETVRNAHQTAARLATSRRRGSQVQHPGLLVVLSAIGHTTRYLNQAAEYSAEGNLALALEYLDRIVQQHATLLEGLHLTTAGERSVLKGIKKAEGDTRRLMEGINITRELSLRSRDLVLSQGERFAIVLIEALLLDRGIPATYVPAKSLVVTTDDFGRATPIFEWTAEQARRLILPHIHRGQVVLTDGFVGATRDGIATTMGSESSDLTATLLGVALGASEIVIWKSVAGIFSADPELIKDAKLIRELSFVESEEIGRRGARVLFPTAPEPLLKVKKEIPLRIAISQLSISKAAGSKGHASLRSTILTRSNISARNTKPLSVVLDQHLCSLRLRVRATMSDTSRSRKPADGSEKHAGIIRTGYDAARGLSLYSVQDTAELYLVLRKEYKSALLRQITLEDFEILELPEVSALSLVFRLPSVGAKPEELFELREQMLKSLRRFDVHAWFSFERSIIAIVEDRRAQAALARLYADFFRH